jgi:tetratricopeptide (TPR) repeat protein/ADP-heptose:LPS heptosyltransferase
MAKVGSRSLPEIQQAFEQAVQRFREGRLDDAEAIAARILKVWPDSFDALHLLGVIRLRRGKAGAALGLIERALKINPNSVDVRSNLALALAALNRDAEALASFNHALALAPDRPDAIGNRATLLMKLGRPAEALPALDRAIALAPSNVGNRINRGNALAALGRFEDAIAQYDELIAAAPTHPELHFNRGNALMGLGRDGDAVAAFDRALAIRCDYFKAHLNRGIALQALNRHQDAVTSFAAALALDKDNADARHNTALSLLTLGDYARGFPQHEARRQRSGMPARRRSLGRPLWLGEFSPDRKTILIHAEQGLGDTIMFIRYAPLLARRGAKVVVEVPAELVSLLGRIEGVSAVVPMGAPLPPFDLHCPVASLPLALRTEVTTIPATIPYLTPSEPHVAKWRARLEGIAGPRVALAWSGSAAHANDRNRSVALDQLAALLALEQVSFVGLQRDVRDADAQALARFPRLTQIGHELEDFEDTAAVASLVDLVISVDTSVVHLAGALGRPTWVLLPFHPDWRWMLEREDSPWYPGARLFRQTAPGDWNGVIERVREGLVKVGLVAAPSP